MLRSLARATPIRDIAAERRGERAIRSPRRRLVWRLLLYADRGDTDMSVILFIVFGFIIGLLARALIPGRQKLGILWTTLLGIAGSFLGGVLANTIAGVPLNEPHAAGFIGSLIGAVALLLLYMAFTRRRTVRGPLSH
jgi:uncharacterized membrane protein YeaQ/YmgE (transglycosylase-associated protein family)